MRKLILLAVAVAVSAPGCALISVDGSSPIATSAAAEERHAEAEDEAATERASERANAAVRETGARLARERTAARVRPTRGCASAAMPASIPAGLDTPMITDAVAAVRPQVQACAASSARRGWVVVSARVAPAGCVLELDTRGSLPPAVADCVADAIANVTFPQTQSGGTFRYPFTM